MESDGVVEVLRTGQFERLLGVHESFTLEFKSEPYRLTENYQKQELAKDISAFANSNGGIVVLGVRTERSDSRPADVAREIRPIPRAMIDPRQHQDILHSWIYPPIEGCTVDLFPAGEKADTVLAAISVPPQRYSTGPFLVVRVVDAESDHTDGVTMSMYQRRPTGSVGLLSPQEVQSLLRDGRLFRRAVDERSQSSGSEQEAPAPAKRRDRISARAPSDTIQKAASLIEAAGLEGDPAFILTATPVPMVDASRMFSSDEDPVVALLANPPEVRPMGFGLSTLQHPEIMQGSSRRSMLRGYKALEFWNDGVLVFVATGGQEFLCWGDRPPESPLRIHPVPLLEATYLFCNLAKRLYEIPPHTPDEVEYTLYFRRLCIGSARPTLSPGRGSTTSQRATKAGPDCDVDCHATDYPAADPGAIAYDLVKQVYTWFGFTYDAIPYVSGNKIDIDAIRRL